MANPTTNYGFVLPTPTDLVTDLPADFDVALQGVDTRLKALQPGTTLGDLAYSSATANTNTRLPIGTSGQVLAVSGGGVPAWTTTADVTPLTTKGDLFTFTTVDARIGVGANGTVLTADSAEATGLKWATPTSKVVQIVTATYSTETTNSTTTYADTGLTATITPTSASNKVLVMVNQNGVARTSSSADNRVSIEIQRAGTTILTIANEAGATSTALRTNIGSVSGDFLDTPATTSATIYKTRFKNAINSSAVVTQEYNISSTIVLMEVTP